MYVNVLFNCANQSTVCSVCIYIYTYVVYVYRNTCTYMIYVIYVIMYMYALCT